MDRRLLAIGIVATLAGLTGLVALVSEGVVQHPDAARTAYGPATFVAIGGCFLALLVGVVVTFRSLVEFPEP